MKMGHKNKVNRRSHTILPFLPGWQGVLIKPVGAQPLNTKIWYWIPDLPWQLHVLFLDHILLTLLSSDFDVQSNTALSS